MEWHRGTRLSGCLLRSWYRVTQHDGGDILVRASDRAVMPEVLVPPGVDWTPRIWSCSPETQCDSGQAWLKHAAELEHVMIRHSTVLGRNASSLVHAEAQTSPFHQHGVFATTCTDNVSGGHPITGSKRRISVGSCRATSLQLPRFPGLTSSSHVATVGSAHGTWYKI